MANLAENRKARFDYEILETFEAGIELTGFEVRAVRMGRMDLSGSYVILRSGEAFLLNANVHPLQPQNTPTYYKSTRTRKLLLTRSELRYLLGKISQKGLTLVPLRVYTKGRYIKLEFALAKGKKHYQKRELLRKKTSEREVRRFLKI